MTADTTAADPIVSIAGLNKWFAFSTCCATSISMSARRAHRGLRAVGLRQVDADPLHQRAGGLPGRPHRGRRHRARPQPAPRRPGAARGRHGFQSFNLFPHLTVLENCTLAPIWVRNIPKKTRKPRR